jgi:hypothetical protein
MPDSQAIVNVNFSTDRALLYDVDPWNKLGFAVPNFGDNIGTLSSPIWALADFIGKVQLLVMTHVDAMREQPPSINTVIRLMKALNRVQSVLGFRQKLDNEVRTEETHASPTLKPWSIHPVPYFGSGFVRNHWLMEFNDLTTIALTNMYQHSDNNLSLTITQAFSQDVYKYFRDMRIMLGGGLLLIDKAKVSADDFIFDPDPNGAMVKSYNPSSFTINFEGMDTPGPIEARPTEDDLRVLFKGIPSVIVKNYLAQYPTLGPKPGEGYAGTQFAATAAAEGTVDGKYVSAPGGTIGQATI